jgi:hypothetical protein
MVVRVQISMLEGATLALTVSVNGMNAAPMRGAPDYCWVCNNALMDGSEKGPENG